MPVQIILILSTRNKEIYLNPLIIDFNPSILEEIETDEIVEKSFMFTDNEEIQKIATTTTTQYKYIVDAYQREYTTFF